MRRRHCCGARDRDNASHERHRTPPGGTPGTRPLVTIQSHILQQQARYPEATGALLVDPLGDVDLRQDDRRAGAPRAARGRARQRRQPERAGRDSSRSSTSSPTTSCCATSAAAQGVAIVASEENEEPVILRDQNDGETRYCVMFDPLDGSSNLDICGGVGTIFSILRKDRALVEASRIRCCSPARGRWPRATCCTARPRCSC